MKTGSMLRAIGLAFGGCILFILLTLLFLPSRLLLQVTNNGLAQYGLKLDSVRIGKSLPLGIKGEGMTLSSPSGELVAVRNGRLSIELLPLLTGRLTVDLEADIGSGTVGGAISLLRSPATRLTVKNVRLEEIPFFKNAAAMKASGILSGKVELAGTMARANGVVQLEVKGAELSGIKIGEMPLPDASYPTVQGMLRVTEGKGAIESFTLQGDDLFVRLKGGLPLTDPLAATPLDMSLELMPKPALLEKQKLVFLLLVKYQDTPGHYLIPVKGTLGKPQVL